MHRNIEKCWRAVTQWVIKHGSLCTALWEPNSVILKFEKGMANFCSKQCSWVSRKYMCLCNIDKYKTM